MYDKINSEYVYSRSTFLQQWYRNLTPNWTNCLTPKLPRIKVNTNPLLLAGFMAMCSQTYTMLCFQH